MSAFALLEKLFASASGVGRIVQYNHYIIETSSSA